MCAKKQTPEAPRVAIPQVATVVQREDHMRVSLERRGRVDEAKLSRHAEMNHEQHIPVEVHEDVFPAPSHIRDPHPGHRVDELLRLRMTDDAREIQLAPHDGASRKVRPQIGDDGLDFRKLRH